MTGRRMPHRLPYDWGRALAHPTMTPQEITCGSEARVRAVSEGAVGDVGGGWTLSDAAPARGAVCR